MTAALTSVLPRILPSGDTALVVEFGRNIDPAINRQVLNLDRNVASEAIAGILETVPTYRSLLVHYDPVQIGYGVLSDSQLLERIATVAAPGADEMVPSAARHISIR